MRDIVAPILLTTLVAVWLGACGLVDDPPDGSGDVAIESAAPTTVLPGSRLALKGGPFETDDTVKVTLSGESPSGSFDISLGGSVRGTRRAEVPIAESAFDAIGPTDGQISTRIELAVTRGDRTIRATETVELAFRRQLRPRIDSIGPNRVAFQDRLTVEGSRMLRSGEGSTTLRFDGSFRGSDGESRSIDEGVELEPVSRGRAHYIHRPDVFGLHTGTFEGEVTIENLHASAGRTTGNTVQMTFDVTPPRIDAVTPDAISRGQRLHVRGVGFVPRRPDARQRTTLVLEGTFTDTEGSTTSMYGSDAVRIEPTYRESGALAWILRPDVERGELVGLGSEPGTFEGDIRARIQRGERTIRTSKKTVDLRILPTKQVVHLKYLPGFSDALRMYGLRNVEGDIKDRILEVCRRDFEPYNLVCRENPPDDFSDYTVLEIGGRDPNDASLFGLDNSEGFDDGNHRLDEVIGGRRATDESRENFTYGGVFVESFLIFSPTLTKSIPIESERFDEIFGPFIPELDGRPVQVDEYPSGPRAEQIATAIRVLGNLVGNTAVHEIGHALGLARTGVDGKVHHQGLKPNLIMNAGADRSFARRAEIDGTKPAIWGKRDSDYLERILPKP